MKILRLIPILFGIAIILVGIYLVGSQGNIAGYNLPKLLGIPECSSANNGTNPCGGFGPFGGFSVGTFVVIFGLGILAAGFRGAMASAAMGGSGGGMSAGGVPPELVASMAQAHARLLAASPGAAAGTGPGPSPNTVYCSKCGRANSADAKFCQQCGAAMPAGT